MAHHSRIKGLRGCVVCSAHISPGFDCQKMSLVQELEAAPRAIILIPRVPVYWQPGNLVALSAVNGDR